MDGTIAILLLQDGLTTGLVYALVGVALVLVFSLTRILMLFIGEFIAFGALTLAALHADNLPGVVWLMPLLGFASGIVRLIRKRKALSSRRVLFTVVWTMAAPGIISAIAFVAAPLSLPIWFDLILTLLLVVPIANFVYMLVFEPIEDAPILTLLISAVGVHLVLIGLGLFFFGPEGLRAPSLAVGTFDLFGLSVTLQSIVVLAATMATLVALYMFFERTYMGTALRAAAINRTGARLVGIRTAQAGQVAFGLSAFVATLCGLLIGPTTTMFYDTGFIIGLKGFVAAVIGVLASYPLTAIAALGVGVLESFVSFFASPFKEAIVFSVILPVLLLRSMLARHVEEDEE